MDLSALKMMEAVLKEYRTLDCSCCNEMFGYMHRKSGTLYCSSSCMTEGQKNNSCSLQTVPSSQLTPHQIQKVVGHIPDTETNGFKDERRAQVKSASEDRVDGSARFSKPISQSAESEVKTAPQKSVLPDPEPPKPVRPEPPFTKKPSHAKATVAPEENPFKKSQAAPKNMAADVSKTPRPTVTQTEPEENPFKKAQTTTAAKKPSRPTVDLDDVEENPFKKSQTAPPKKAADVSKTPRPTVTQKEPEENPFKKAQTTTAAKKPSQKPSEIVLDPTILKIRSALPWDQYVDKHIGLMLLGGKSNDNGPSDFCFQSAAMTAKALALQKDIETFTRSATAIPLKRLEIGTLVFAPFCGETFRGEIIGIPSKETAEVFFIDYGNTQELSIKQISKLPKEFQDIPRICFHCKWDLWLTLDSKAPVEDAITTCYHSTEAQGLMPIRKLSDGQYLVAIGTPAQNVNFTAQECPKFDKVPVGWPFEKVEEKEAPKPQPSKPKVLRKKYFFKDCVYSPSLVDGCIVKLAYVWGFTKFMAVSVDDEKPLNEVQALVIQCVGDPKNQLKERPDVQEVVLAPYQGDYYRARVVELPEDPNTVKVLFFDYGDTDIVKVSDLFQPSIEIIQHPVYAMNVDLHGLKNETTQPNLSSEANEVLALPLHLQIMKKPNLEDPNSDHVFDVTLWNEDTSLNKIMKKAFDAAKGN